MEVEFFGLKTIATLPAFANERYAVITSLQAIAKWKMTHHQGRKINPGCNTALSG